MADEYIRRVEAEEAIEEYCCRMCKDYNEIEGGCVSHAQHCQHLTGEEILKPVESADVQPVNQWISCKDKMPEHGVTVLIYTGNHTISLAWYDKDMEFFYICDSDYKYNPLDVTHWQPLPEPPKEG